MSTHSALVVRDLTVTFRDRTALAGVDLIASPGRRIGLVGENGSGKSTLLRAVAGRLPSRAKVTGTIDAPADLAMLGQEPPFRDEATIDEVLASALRPLRQAVADVERLASGLEDPARAAAYAERLDWALAHDAWGADRRAQEAAHRLGLDDLSGDRRIHTLSGGERTRLALATLMTIRPACLLLDEPTNHLDDDAIGVVSEFLAGLPGVVLVATHDRVLLDEVCTDLIDLDPSEFGTDGRGGNRFGGTAGVGVWTAYEQHRAAARRRWEETYALQQEELVRLRAATDIGTEAIAHNRGPRDNDKFIYGFKGSNVERALARRKKDANRRLKEAEHNQVRKPRPPLRLRADLTDAGATGQVVLVRELRVPGRMRLERLDVHAGEHLLVTGPNGSGKSTLLGVLSGRVPCEGEVQVNARRVAELVQDVTFDDMRRSARSVYDQALPDGPPLRDLGLLHPRDHARPVGLLSVGQRRRLGLALAIADAPDLLLLDEPTNHLSLALAAELEEALEATPGTVIVASHDRWLRRRWNGATLQIGEQR